MVGYGSEPSLPNGVPSLEALQVRAEDGSSKGGYNTT